MRTELKVIRQRQRSPWYAGGLDFACTACGNCCTGGPGYVWISEEEIRRLAAHLEVSAEDVRQLYCRPLGGRWSLREQRNARGDYDCVFLREQPSQQGTSEGGQVKRMCQIYAVRPLQCRTWPFWEGTLASEQAWAGARRRCPGIGRGRRYTRREIEALRHAKDWPKSEQKA